MKIGSRITEIREGAGLSQSGLARAIGTSQSAISQIEAGDRNPSFEMLRQIAEALNVSLPHLVGADHGLTDAEQVLFRDYRGLTEDGQKELKLFAAYLRHRYGAENPAADD